MLVCPACGQENPRIARFCLACASPLGPASEREERRTVTLLFCDLVGFTAASEQADPEDVLRRLRLYHGRVKRDIETFGGVVAKFIGDAVVGVFGAPRAHEDDPERAVRAGLRVIEAIDELNGADPALDLRVRVGINTGEVIVSSAYLSTPDEGMVAGDAINTASRLQSCAPINGVVVGAATFRSTERTFYYQELEAVVVKGKAAPVALWRAIRARPRSGTEVPRSGRPAMVDRTEELEILERMFDRSVSDRSCQLATVVGEPGIGKSRLVAELQARLGALPERANSWRRGRCLPYGDGIAFWALAEIVKSHAGIFDSDPPDVVIAKLEAALPGTRGDQWLLPRLLPLLGLGAASTAEREDSFLAWRRFLEAIAEASPAIIVMEDLHWADESLLAFIEEVAIRSDGVPMLLLCTARGEFLERHTSWAGGVRNAITINLRSLSHADTRTLVATLVDRAVGPAEVEERILERSGGNPLYAEELVRLLRDRRALSGDSLLSAEAIDAPSAIPDAIAALIAARLDLLSPECKAVLADASVIGETFWAGAVAALGERDLPTVHESLDELVHRELLKPVRRSTLPGQAEFTFWHALVREVAYAQLTRAVRGERHRRAAAWIESVAPDRLEDLSELIAHHYTSALDLLRASGRIDDAREFRGPALRYLIMAGDRAAALDVPTAERHYRRALDLAVPQSSEGAALLGKLAGIEQLRGMLAEAAGLYQEAMALHETLGETIAVGDLAVPLAVVLDTQGERKKARALIDGLVARLEPEDPSPQLARAYAELAYSGWSAPAESVEWAEKALTLAERLDLPDVKARALGFRGGSRAQLGDPAGLADLRSALALSIQLGLARSSYVIYVNMVLHLCAESPPAALELGEEALSFVRARGLAEGEAVTRAVRLEALLQIGRWDELLAEAEDLVAWAERVGDRWMRVNASYPKAWVLSLRGASVDAANLVESLAPDIEELDAATLFAIPRVRAQRAQGSRAEAVRILEELIVDFEHDGRPLSGLLPHTAREAVALDRPDLLRRCAALAGGDFAVARHGRTTLEALSAESAGGYDAGAEAFLSAARAWDQFGNPYERGQALFGAARCMRVGRAAEAEASLAKARQAFAALGISDSLTISP